MTDTYTTHARLTKQEVGAHDSSWGAILNSMMDLIEELAIGQTSQVLSGNVTLTTIADGSSTSTRNMFFDFTGALAALTDVTIPSGLKKTFIFRNSTNKPLRIVQTTAVSLPINGVVLVMATGTNVVVLARIETRKIITSSDSPYQAVYGEHVMCDATSGAITVTLPASPTISDPPVRITKIAGAFAVTIGRNSQSIQTVAADMTLPGGSSVELAFSSATPGWRIIGSVLGA